MHLECAYNVMWLKCIVHDDSARQVNEMHYGEKCIIKKKQSLTFEMVFECAYEIERSRSRGELYHIQRNSFGFWADVYGVCVFVWEPVDC